MKAEGFRGLHWLVTALMFVAGLAGCGFHLRGQADLPFTSAYINAPAGLAIAESLRRELRSAKREVAEKPEAAQVVIHLSGGGRDKQILSLSGRGRVNEYRLSYRVSMRVTEPHGGELLPAAEVFLTRDYAYDDQQILAKAQEEQQLFAAMEQDALRALMRRLRFAQPQGATPRP